VEQKQPTAETVGLVVVVVRTTRDLVEHFLPLRAAVAARAVMAVMEEMALAWVVLLLQLVRPVPLAAERAERGKPAVVQTPVAGLEYMDKVQTVFIRAALAVVEVE
jgi:hypothetical protein